jgi:hypothetical protein
VIGSAAKPDERRQGDRKVDSPTLPRYRAATQMTEIRRRGLRAGRAFQPPPVESPVGVSHAVAEGDLYAVCGDPLIGFTLTEQSWGSVSEHRRCAACRAGLEAARAS